MRSGAEGQILGGKYRLVHRLGRGGMGTVWRAEHLTLNSPVALKLIEPSSTVQDSQALQRFMREARTAAALRSPHVVQILDYGVEDDVPFIVMELLEGESLAERLARVGQLGMPDTARIIQQVARALARAHDAGIVHRDLKPANIFMVKNDDEEVAKVLDFGIVKTRPGALGATSDGATSTQTGTLLGTPYFMSPEQLEASKAVNFKADIWALGVIAYRSVLGRLPFTGDSVGRLVLEICTRPLPVPSEIGSVPNGFDAWFARVCNRDPEKRFASAKLAAAEFTRLAQLEPLPIAKSLTVEANHHEVVLDTTQAAAISEVNAPAPKSSRRRRLQLAALAALAVFSATSVVLVGLRTTAQRAQEVPAQVQPAPPALLPAAVVETKSLAPSAGSAPAPSTVPPGPAPSAPATVPPPPAPAEPSLDAPSVASGAASGVPAATNARRARAAEVPARKSERVRKAARPVASKPAVTEPPAEPAEPAKPAVDLGI
jgi:eukaryotic-like serine/threonine-protein kinase